MRQVVNIYRDGGFFIVPDITDEEIKAVFPTLVQHAANLQRIVTQLSPNMMYWPQPDNDSDGGKKFSG